MIEYIPGEDNAIGTRVHRQIEISIDDELRLADVVGKWKAHEPKGVKSCLDKHTGSGWTTEECFDLVERAVRDWVRGELRQKVSRGLLKGWLKMRDTHDWFLQSADRDLRNLILEAVWCEICGVDDAELR